MNNPEHDPAGENPTPKDEQSAVRSFAYVVAALLTAMICLLAIVQVSGRLASAYAGVLTPQFNAVLAPYRAEVSGVSGDWRGFNPVLRIQRVSFAAGDLQNLYVELDFVQSLTRWKPIFRRFYSQEGEVGVVYTPRGWALKNSRQQPIDIDFVELLNSSEFVDVTLHVMAERADEAFHYGIELSVNNGPGNRYGRLKIDSPGGSEPLLLAYAESTTASNGNDLRRNQSLRFSAKGAVEIPAALTGGTEIMLA